MLELICDSCGRNAEFKAYRLSETTPHAERNLCRVCAEDFERVHCGNSGLPLTKLLNSLVVSQSSKCSKSERTSVCPQCGNNVCNVVESGIVGCPMCYEVFREEVESMVRRLHGV